MMQILLDGTSPPPPPPKLARVRQTLAARAAERARKAKETVEYDWKIPAATPRETAFRHSHWRAKRGKVLAALQAAGQSEFAVDRFIQCGSDAVVEWNEEEQRYRVACNTCKNRHCEPCQKARANKMAANLKARLEQKAEGRYRFVTLTLRHTRTPLADQLKRLQNCFKVLRKTPLWKKSQLGGAAIIEVKWCSKTRLWHPHLHVVTEGSYVRQGDLSAAWLTITGDSSIVDIRSLTNGRDAAYYVAKYVTKGTSSEVWNDADAAAEWICATKGVRVCNTFGNWRGYKLMANPVSTGTWKPLTRIDDLMQRVAAGSISALHLFFALPGPNHEHLDGS